MARTATKPKTKRTRTRATKPATKTDLKNSKETVSVKGAKPKRTRTRTKKNPVQEQVKKDIAKKRRPATKRKPVSTKVNKTTKKKPVSTKANKPVEKRKRTVKPIVDKKQTMRKPPKTIEITDKDRFDDSQLFQEVKKGLVTGKYKWHHFANDCQYYEVL